MNIAHIDTSFIYGPGKRFVIWTQGCSIRCPGCWNNDMWSFDKRNLISVKKLFKIITAQSDIEGITLLGGEPLDQYDDVLALLRLCKTSALSVMLFTGYETAEMQQAGRSAIFEYVDILISGPYQKDKRTLNAQWIGSTNQVIHFLSDRYRPYQRKDANYVEIEIEETGGLTILGFPDTDFLNSIDVTRDE